MVKKIEITTEYITLGQFLKFSGIISNGAEAKHYLEEYNVLVNGELENRRGRKLYPEYVVLIDGLSYRIESKWKNVLY